MAQVTFNTYGKTGVRLTQVVRNGERHELTEIAVKILFEGDLESSYTEGDNSKVLPTDTMKNAVYVIARLKPIRSIEEFARDLARHFFDTVSHLMQVAINVVQRPWARFEESGSTFVQSGNETRWTTLTATRSNHVFVSGIGNLEILKTKDSGFAGFLKDKYTTLPETDDRLMGTVLEADWTYRSKEVDFNACHRRIRNMLLDTFANHRSLSVQHTIYEMGRSVTDAVRDIAEIHLVMPNKHRILFDLSRFGLDNPNQVFVSTDEPSGFIEVRIANQD